MGKQFQVVLPDDLAAELTAAVSEGEYTSEAELILEAIEDWQGRRLEDVIPVERLRSLLQEGVDCGPPIEASEVFKRLRERYGTASCCEG